MEHRVTIVTGLLHASSFHFIVSAYSLLALAFLLSGHMLQVFRVYVLVHGLTFCVRNVTILFKYPAHDTSVWALLCFVKLLICLLYTSDAADE